MLYNACSLTCLKIQFVKTIVPEFQLHFYQSEMFETKQLKVFFSEFPESHEIKFIAMYSISLSSRVKM